MGYFRFFLAYLVLISHVGIYLPDFNEGVFAVVIFYILAGHVTSRLFFKIFNRNGLDFYKDRFLRIFPLYWFFTTVTLIFILITGFGNPIINSTNIPSNYILIPLNYYMYIEKYIYVIEVDKIKWWLVPPAWSLATEVQVYILMPILLRWKLLFRLAFLITFAIYMLANLNYLHSDYFGYRLILGVLFIFLIGVILEQRRLGLLSKFDKSMLIATYVFLLLYSIIGILYLKKYGVYTKETVLGILLGVPAILLIFKIDKKTSLNKFFGYLSYAVFLSHFLAIWIYKYLQLPQNKLYELAFVSIVSILMSVVGVLLVDKKLEKIRIKQNVS